METKTTTASVRLYNDNDHSQKMVLDMLRRLMGHTMDQAIQCIMLIEMKGSYTVKEDMVDITRAVDIVGALNLMGFKAELEYN
jgi:hypothetical protein